MEQTSLMHLKVLVPFEVFADAPSVKRIVAETSEGSFGLLPHRLDCAAALPPGILMYETEEEGEIYLAIDQGVLVKAGAEVSVSVRNAIRGSGLSSLRRAVEQQFLALDADELNARSVLAKMESGFIGRLMELQAK
jgi:F-type H+-transporting ATPase subunit epsilon